MATYTDAQIQDVCNHAAKVMEGFTEVQNCQFPSTAIIEGMKAGKTPEEIANAAYDAVSGLPLYQTGFGLVGTGNTMHNIASFMRGAVLEDIKALAGSSTPTAPTTPTTPTPENPGTAESDS